MRRKTLFGALLCAAVFGVLTVQIVKGDYLLAKFGFAFVIAVCVLDSIIYSFRGYGMLEDKVQKPAYPVAWLCAISGILLLVYLPICIKGFFFHDDYINFKGIVGGNNFFEFTATQGRQGTGILTDLMNYVTVENSWHLRVIAVGGVIIYAWVIAQILNALNFSKLKTAGLCLALGIITPVINVASYGSMFCYPLAFVFAARGIVCYRNAFAVEKTASGKWLLLINGGLHIIVANYIYQATATVAFVVILLMVMYDKKEYRIFPAIATVGYIVATGIYYITVKMFSFMNPTGLMGRAGIISSLEEIAGKIQFFGLVLQENTKQLAVSFLGNSMVQSPWMHYLLAFKSDGVEKVAMLLVASLLVLGLYRVLRQKGIFACIETIIILPLSYYVFLVLAESSYTSYYSVALCSAMLILSLSGVEQILAWITPRTEKGKRWNSFAKIFGCLSVGIMLLNGGFYLNHFWVDYNFYGFTFLKQVINQSYQGQSRIHVVGDLYPGQADVYGKAAAAIACRELNLPYDTIQFSESRYMGYIDQLDLSLYKQMIEGLSAEEQAFFASCYDINENFNLCTMRYEEMNDEKYAVLSDIFSKTGVIPSENDPDSLIVDIRGIHSVLAN